MAAQPQLASVMARQLVQKLAGGGMQGTPQPGGPQQAAGMNAQGSDTGTQISQQLAELNGADPASTLKILQEMKSMAVALYPRTAFSIPGVARNIAQAQKYLDNAIKEAEQAAATASTVQSPIANSTGISPQSPNQSALPGLQQFAANGGS